MRLKNWLLTGTSIGLLAFAPLSAHAQDAELQSAYQAYLEAQASGDAAALESAQTMLTELCIVGGYASLEECIAALQSGGGEQPVAEEPVVEEEAPAEEPVAEEPAPVEEPAAEEPVAEEPVVEEPVAEEPVMEEAPVAEEPVAEEPVAEEPVAEEPVVEEPVAEEPAVEAEPVQEEPVAEEPAAEEPAAEAPAAEEPAAEEAPPAEEPAVEEAAPAEEQPAEAPAVEAEAGFEAELAAQVDAYNSAVADLAAGDAEAQARIDAALAEITGICSVVGYDDVNACVAEFGLELSPLPEGGAPVAEEQPAEAVPGDEQPEPVEETTSDGQPAEIVEELPEGVTQDQIAPVLDSAKDEDAAPAEGAQPVEGEAAVEGEVEVEAEAEAEAEVAEPAAEEPSAPAPTNDQEAQSEATRAFAAQPMAAVNEEQGEAVTAADESTTVNQTIVNNYVTNITNNVSGDNNTVQTGVQQTPVTVVEADVEEPANTGDAITQLILQVGTQLIVNSVGQDTDRFYDPQEDEIYYERLSNDRVREVITRPDGTQIVTVRNRNGDILRRSRITPDGREYVLAYFEESYYDDLVEWRDPAESLPPLRLNIPVREYVLDSRYADENELEVFFSQPPVEQVARLYSIDEVKRSARLRDSVRRLEVGNLTFDTGAATIGRDQVQSLSGVANAMLALLERNPNETFLIEGHTDAVGADISNLRLSDLRAATVARVLTDFYDVPPENLATQGYGERYLKIRTEVAERENRRVTIRRITPLITVAAQ